MKKPINLVKDLFDFLNDNISYAVLRNFDGLPHNNPSRDIDIIVAEKEFNSIIRSFVDVATNSGYKIFSYYKSEKVCTLVFGFVDKSDSDFVQFDFFFNTSIFGVLLCDASELLKNKEFNGEIYHVSKEFEFLDKYLQLKLLGKNYPDKYKSIKEEVTASLYLDKLLHLSSVEDVDKLSLNKFRLLSLLGSFKNHGVKQVSLPFRFIYHHIKNVVSYNGFSLSFTGPDGAGKTSVIELLKVRMSQVYSDISYYHYRPDILPNIGAAAKKAKVIKSVDTDYSNPHRGSKTGTLNSAIRYLYYSADYVLGYFLKVRRKLSRRNVVIFDRYHTDILTDSRRSRIYINFKWLTKFYNLCIPKMDYPFFLTAPSEVIHERKQELTKESIESINDKIDYLKDNIHSHVIINDISPDDAVYKILSIIGESQHIKHDRKIK